jgi:7-carboxy-7-deazaguanine synthase
MKVKQLITAFPTEKKERPEHTNYLRVSEFFYDSIQGEGINLGYPAAFLRLQACTLNCVWCDTKEVWRQGNPYTFDELLNMIYDSGAIRQFERGQHLVITGGSPLLQQVPLINFLYAFSERFGFMPYVEVENECVLHPNELVSIVSCWNNSPKLSSSGNRMDHRFLPDVIREMSKIVNSWFKFVITGPEDWDEIRTLFINSGYIRREQIILMPEGMTRVEIAAHADMVVEIAIREGVLYRSREHIVLWDKKTGV